jgi:hypothetical protein
MHKNNIFCLYLSLFLIQRKIEQERKRQGQEKG